MLIEHAEDIGMVSESLYERTTLMSACWPSEDELEKSDTTTHDDSKTTKKKKRRSGSLQGRSRAAILCKSHINLKPMTSCHVYYIY